MNNIETSLRQIYELHYPIFQAMRDIQMPFPKGLATITSFLFNTEIIRILQNEEIDVVLLRQTQNDARKYAVNLDIPELSFILSNICNSISHKLTGTKNDILLLEKLEAILEIFSTLPLKLNLWEAQNAYFALLKKVKIMDKKSDENELWLNQFEELGKYLLEVKPE